MQKGVRRHRSTRLEARPLFFRYGSFRIKDGSFMTEFKVWNHPSYTITKMLRTSPNMSFRLVLIGVRLAAWHTLQERLALLQLSQGYAEFRCNLHDNGMFLVDFMYKALAHSDNKPIWKIKYLLRLKSLFCSFFELLS
jgi:hypothetical protein